MGKYWTILSDNPNIVLQTTTELNPATLLPITETVSDHQHNCLEIIDQVYSTQPDLSDQPLVDFDWELYTDGSSFMENGQQTARYTVVTTNKVIKAPAFLSGTSA